VTYELREKKKLTKNCGSNCWRFLFEFIRKYKKNLKH